MNYLIDIVVVFTYLSNAIPKIESDWPPSYIISSPFKKKK